MDEKLKPQCEKTILNVHYYSYSGNEEDEDEIKSSVNVSFIPYQ